MLLRSASAAFQRVASRGWSEVPDFLVFFDVEGALVIGTLWRNFHSGLIQDDFLARSDAGMSESFDTVPLVNRASAL